MSNKNLLDEIAKINPSPKTDTLENDKRAEDWSANLISKQENEIFK